MYGPTRVIAKRVYLAVVIEVHDLGADGQKIGKLVDSLAKINGINIDKLTLDFQNKLKVETQAKAAAF